MSQKTGGARRKPKCAMSIDGALRESAYCGISVRISVSISVMYVAIRISIKVGWV